MKSETFKATSTTRSRPEKKEPWLRAAYEEIKELEEKMVNSR